MNSHQNGVFLLLVILLLFPATIVSLPAASDKGEDSPSVAKYLPLPLETLPLRLRRIYKPEEPLPSSGEGLYVDSVSEETVLYEGGLRPGMVVREINGVPVNTRVELASELSKSLGKSITVTIWDPQSGGSTRELRFRYDLDRNSVVVHPGGSLFHNPELNHSPDSSLHPSYSSPYRAKAKGYKPCPVCFPDDEESLWQEVIRRGIGAPSPFVQKLINTYGRVKPVPPEVNDLFEGLVEHRLRHRLRPSLIVLDTRQLYGISSPNGVIVISEGLLSFAETRRQKELILAHMLAHADRKHPPRSIRAQQATSILNEAIDRVADVAVGIDDLGDLLFNAFGFTFQRRWQGRGYDEPQEREAIFLSLYYLYKDGAPMNVVSRWETKRRDMARNIHENWANYLVMHPASVMPDRTEDWMSSIRSEIVPQESNSFTPHESTRARIELYRSGYRFDENSLARAMNGGDTSAVQAFLEAGWDPASTLSLTVKSGSDTSSRRTVHPPLIHYAAALGDPTIVRLLLDRGADPNQVYEGPLPSTDLRDVTPLFSALVPSAYAGAEPGAPRSSTSSPEEPSRPRAEFVRFLLREGADPHHSSRGGTTPVDLATSRGHESIASLLEDAR